LPSEHRSRSHWPQSGAPFVWRVAPARARFVLTPERVPCTVTWSARTAAAKGNRGQQAGQVRSVTLRCQTKLVLSVRSDILPGGEKERQRSVAFGKWPCSRLLPIVLAGRSLAAYCGVLPVRSIAGYCGSWPDEVSRPTGAIGLRYCWFMSGEASRHLAVLSLGAPDLRPVSSVCGRWNAAKRSA
jgi:hypothetical protein